MASSYILPYPSFTNLSGQNFPSLADQQPNKQCSWVSLFLIILIIVIVAYLAYSYYYKAPETPPKDVVPSTVKAMVARAPAPTPQPRPQPQPQSNQQQQLMQQQQMQQIQQQQMQQMQQQQMPGTEKQGSFGPELNAGEENSLVSGQGRFTGNVAVLFFSERCGHCRAMAAEYKRASESNPGKFVAIDGEKFPKLMEKYQITGFPTILMLSKGAVVANFNGARTSSALTEFVENFKNSKSVNFAQPESNGGGGDVHGDELDPNQLDSLLGGKGLFSSPVVLMFYGTHCGHCKVMAPIFKSAAKKSKIPMIAVDAGKFPKLLEKFKITGVPMVLKIERGAIVKTFEGDRTEEKLLSFANGPGGNVLNSSKGIDELNSKFLDSQPFM